MISDFADPLGFDSDDKIKSPSFWMDFLAGAEGVEPSLMVLETTVKPFNYAPILNLVNGGPSGTRTPDRPVMSRLL